MMRQINTKIDKKKWIYFKSVPFLINKCIKNSKHLWIEKGTLPKRIHFLVYFCIYLSHHIEHKVNILANYFSIAIWYTYVSASFIIARHVADFFPSMDFDLFMRSVASSNGLDVLISFSKLTVLPFATDCVGRYSLGNAKCLKSKSNGVYCWA